MSTTFSCANPIFGPPLLQKQVETGDQEEEEEDKAKERKSLHGSTENFSRPKSTAS